MKIDLNNIVTALPFYWVIKLSYKTAKKTISCGQGAQLPLPKSLVHRRLYGRTWLLHGRPWAQVLT